MKKALLLVCFITTITSALYAQCGCVTRKMDDQVIKQCPPKLIAGDNNYQVALSIQDINENKFVLMTIRFRNFANTVASDLQIFTNSESVLNLKLIKSGKDYVGGSQICHAQFAITNSDKKILENFGISSIRFHYENEDIYRTFEAKQNEDVLMEYMKCL